MVQWKKVGLLKGNVICLCTFIVFSRKMKVIISFVNWFELYLTQRETKSMPELPVGVSELHPVAAFFIRNGQQHYRALAGFTCSS